MGERSRSGYCEVDDSDPSSSSGSDRWTKDLKIAKLTADEACQWK